MWAGGKCTTTSMGTVAAPPPIKRAADRRPPLRRTTATRTQIEGGARVTGLELHPSGKRLMVTCADPTVRFYLLHRPGDRQPLRQQARAAAARQQQQQQQGAAGPVPPEEWAAVEPAVARGAASRPPKHRNSLFYEDGASWLTFQHKFSLDRRPWGCAALSPGVCEEPCLGNGPGMECSSAGGGA